MFLSFILLIISILQCPINSADSDHLNLFGIKSYQYIRAIHDETPTTSPRQKRSANEDNAERILVIELDQKNLTLILTKTNDFVSSDADIHLGSSTYLPIDTSILYKGYLLDHPDSSTIHGGFYSNWFDGTIHLSNETWHVEPIRKYGSAFTNSNGSIIYNALDVNWEEYEKNRPFRSPRATENEESSWTYCGWSDRVKREEMQRESQHFPRENDEFKSHSTKRTAGNEDQERTCCYLYLRIDPTLWTLVFINEGLREKAATVHALVTFIYRTVTATNGIYRSVKFEHSNDTFYRFTLRVKRIRIITPDDCDGNQISLSEQNLCRPYLDSNVLLTWHSAEDFGQYCLAYLFSARDFGDGTLGLAWIGSVTSSTRGGICEKPARDIYEGHRVYKTLNTGIITVINHHSRVPSLMTDLTFAHEVGHSLGAEHDDQQCEGGGRNGHYLMYRRATTGLEKNNNIFSNCSLEKMGQLVIAVKNGMGGKTNCFSTCSQLGYCGNRNVEDNEECDCGFASECTDPCCYPADGVDPKLACKLKPGARCSPSRGPCCSNECNFHSSTHICHQDQGSDDCIGEVRCDGTQASCPLNDPQFFKPTDTPCNFYTALCDRGRCNKSVCTFIGQTECQLTIPNVPDPLRQRGVDREYLCHIGCFDARTNTCVDTHQLRMGNNRSQTGYGYKYRPGHACAGTTGYCDVFGRCRLVDAEGPLTRLKNMFLSEENIRTLTELCQDYWWILLLGLLGLLGFLSIFVKLCSVHTPSSNPRLRPARPLSFKRQSSPRRRALPMPSPLIEHEQEPEATRVAQVYVYRSATSDDENNTSCL